MKRKDLSEKDAVAAYGMNMCSHFKNRIKYHSQVSEELAEQIVGENIHLLDFKIQSYVQWIAK